MDVQVPIAWGVAPIIGDLFPGLWEYYVTTARANDQFFGATGGVGYTYPWSLPELSAYYTKAKALWEMRMPHSHNWVDMWEVQSVLTFNGCIFQRLCATMYAC